MERIKLDVEWLLAHGFERIGGMQPVGQGQEYRLKLSKTESISVYISTTPDSYGSHGLHMSVRTKFTKAELSKSSFNSEMTDKNYFYLDELFTLFDLTGNSECKEFFTD